MAMKIAVFKADPTYKCTLSNEQKAEEVKQLFMKLQGAISDIAMLGLSQTELDLAAGIHFLEMKKLGIPFEKIASIHFDHD